jgi:uncharacterized protein with PIN domain
MLGTLAKWLRILGYDALFDPVLDDHRLVRIARAENRVLLTRDRDLARRRGVRALLIVSEHLDDQIRQVHRDMGLAIDQSWARGSSRCPVCNEILEQLDRQSAEARVPPYVAQTHQEFKHCPACRRIYWRGSHWRRMDEFVDQLQSSLPGDA